MSNEFLIQDTHIKIVSQLTNAKRFLSPRSENDPVRQYVPSHRQAMPKKLDVDFLFSAHSLKHTTVAKGRAEGESQRPEGANSSDVLGIAVLTSKKRTNLWPKV